ncbi:MAG: hypothetical protein ND895_06190 [Pyrinomonadaceae bacterium]|nr:hypothetical protein [Pyrinomonadaceae bacterium]
MSRKPRFAFGFVLGLILLVCALLLSGAGHGTYAPVIANASVLALIPGLGFLIPPFLWALYFLVIPEIDPPVRKVIALVLIALLHMVPGIWIASEDPAFIRALESNFGVVVAHGLTLVAAIISLAVFSSLESRNP